MTLNQRKLYEFIYQFCDTENHSPSFNQMQKGIGAKSKSGIHKMLDELKKLGLIRFTHGKNRSVWPVKLSHKTPTLKGKNND